jgi:histidine triad (HIT) family protein
MAYDEGNVFARILRGEIRSARVYEDDEFIAIRDIEPAAPTHILVMPRAPRAGPADLRADDAGWVGRMVLVATRLAAEQGLARDGYRLVLNQGEDAGQAVPHLHLHILGGGALGPFA